jgi:hypothetical protein
MMTARAEPTDATETGVSQHAYPASAMAGDYLRAAAGLVPAGVLLTSVPIATVGGIVLASLAAIFGAFAARTVVRHGTTIEVGASGLRTLGPRRRSIAWDKLDRLKLGYYSTRRDRRAGWMQLDLGAGRTRVRLDSRLDGFDAVVRQAAAAAAVRGLALTPATVSNLQALGIRLPAFGAGR